MSFLCYIHTDGWLPILEDYNYVLVTSGTCQDLNVAAIALPGFMYDMTFNPYLKNEHIPQGARDMCNYAANTIHNKNYILASSNPTLIINNGNHKPAGCSIDATQATVATTGLYWNPIQDLRIKCNGSNTHWKSGCFLVSVKNGKFDDFFQLFSQKKFVVKNLTEINWQNMEKLRF